MSPGVVVVVVAVRSRQSEPLIVVDEHGVQENIVCYDDEGGGEEDTEAFNILALRHPNKAGQSQPRPLTNAAEITPAGDWLFHQFIKDRLQQADQDLAAPPYDSLQTYAFEGSGSSAASLSSLNSADSSSSPETQQNFDFLQDWGPRFRKLADLYGHHEEGP